MKRIIIFLLIVTPLAASGQVVSFAKTLPVRAFSVGITPSYFLDPSGNNVGLRSIGVEADQGGALAVGLSGGYGINYSLDMNAKIVYVLDGVSFFGVDFQYLVHEARYSYFSVIAGLHYWDGFGVDLTGLFTYSPRYSVNLTVGLDMDIYSDPDNKILARAWLPVNAGFNLNDVTFLFAEFDLPVSQWSWGIVSVGANFILR
jgi:hypothetical protein